MKVLVTPCDRIGPEIIAETMEVLEAAGAAFSLGLEYHFGEAGFTSLKKYGTTLRDETLERARAYDGVVLGPQSHMDYPACDGPLPALWTAG